MSFRIGIEVGWFVNISIPTHQKSLIDARGLLPACCDSSCRLKLKFVSGNLCKLTLWTEQTTWFVQGGDIMNEHHVVSISFENICRGIANKTEQEGKTSSDSASIMSALSSLTF